VSKIKLPHNNDAEVGVLGSCLLDHEAVMIAASELTRDDFYSEIHKAVFDAIRATIAKSKPCDPVTVMDELAAAGKLRDVGKPGLVTPQKIRDLTDEVPSSSNVEYYVKIVKEMSRLRSIAIGAYEQIKAINNGARLEDILRMPDPRVRAVENVRPSEDISSLLTEFWDKYEREERVDAFPSGLDVLDDAMDGGFWRSEMTVLAARPSVGKTSLACNIAVNVAKAGYKVLFVTREMPEETLLQRMIAAESGVDFRLIRQGDRSCLPQVKDAISKLYNLPMRITRAGTVEAIKLEVGDADMVIIDYLHAMDLPKGGPDKLHVVLGEVVRKLFMMSLDMGVHVLLLAQLNRNVERRGEKARPMLSDLREAGKLEEAADNVIFLHRPAGAHAIGETAHDVEVIIAKQRNGPTGVLHGIRVEDRCMRWESDYIPSLHSDDEGGVL